MRRNPFRDVRSLADYVHEPARRRIDACPNRPVILITGTRKGIGLALARHYLGGASASWGAAASRSELRGSRLHPPLPRRRRRGRREADARRRAISVRPARRAGQQRRHRGDEPRPADAHGDRSAHPGDERRGHVPALPRGGQAAAGRPARADRQPLDGRRPVASGGGGDLRRLQGGRRGPDARPGQRTRPDGHHLQRRRPDADRDRPDRRRALARRSSGLLARQAIHRLGRPDDVANVIDFFLRPESDFVTGRSSTWEVSLERTWLLDRMRQWGDRGGARRRRGHGHVPRAGSTAWPVWNETARTAAGVGPATVVAFDGDFSGPNRLAAAGPDPPRLRRGAALPRPPRARRPSSWTSPRVEHVDRLPGRGEPAIRCSRPATLDRATISSRTWRAEGTPGPGPVLLRIDRPAQGDAPRLRPAAEEVRGPAPGVPHDLVPADGPHRRHQHPVLRPGPRWHGRQRPRPPPGDDLPGHRAAPRRDPAHQPDLPEPAAALRRAPAARPVEPEADHLRHRDHAGQHPGTAPRRPSPESVSSRPTASRRWASSGARAARTGRCGSRSAAKGTRPRSSTACCGSGPSRPCWATSTPRAPSTPRAGSTPRTQVEQDGEWLRFLGRTTEIINVGGQKVYPAEVESALLEMDNVVDATVRGERNPIVGQCVVARVNLREPESRGRLQVPDAPALRRTAWPLHDPGQGRDHRLGAVQRPGQEDAAAMSDRPGPATPAPRPANGSSIASPQPRDRGRSRYRRTGPRATTTAGAVSSGC